MRTTRMAAGTVLVLGSLAAGACSGGSRGQPNAEQARIADTGNPNNANTNTRVDMSATPRLGDSTSGIVPPSQVPGTRAPLAGDSTGASTRKPAPTVPPAPRH